MALTPFQFRHRLVRAHIGVAAKRNICARLRRANRYGLPNAARRARHNQFFVCKREVH